MLAGVLMVKVLLKLIRLTRSFGIAAPLLSNKSRVTPTQTVASTWERNVARVKNLRSGAHIMRVGRRLP